MDTIANHVENLAKRAAEAKDSGDAMRFSQAAVNAANAAAQLSNLRRDEK